MPNVIKVQKIPRKQVSLEDLLATFCYHFPQYKFHEARKLPYKRIIQMLKVVKKEQAKDRAELLRIVIAPHSKRGSAKSLFEKFNAIINE